MGALFLRFPEGKTKALTLSYDDGVEHASAWVLEKGTYRFFVGNSVRNTVEIEEKMVLEEDRIVSKCSARTSEKLPEAGEKKRVNMLADVPLEKGLEPDVKAVPSDGGHDHKKMEMFGRVAEGKTSMDEFIAMLTVVEDGLIPVCICQE